MDQQEGMSSNRAPLFKGDDYALWKIRMTSHLMALGFGVCKSLMKGQDAPSSSFVDVDEKEYTNDAKDMNTILNGMENLVFVNGMHYKSSKEIWDKLECIYEGDTKVKKGKLQTYRAQFENLKMKEEERIA